MVRGTGAAHPVPGPPVTSALREVWSDLAALYMALLTPEAMAARLDRALVLLLAAPIGTPSDGVGPPPLPWVLWGVAGGRARWAKLVRERGEDGAREAMGERGRKGFQKLVAERGEDGAREAMRELARRGKRAFTETQYTVLEAEYAENPYTTPDGAQEIADTADLTKQQVYQWFKNKRRRMHPAPGCA